MQYCSKFCKQINYQGLRWWILDCFAGNDNCVFLIIFGYLCLFAEFYLVKVVQLTSIFISYHIVCAGGNADYAMDMHQKEQLHDNTVPMMQSQHFSVGYII